MRKVLCVKGVKWTLEGFREKLGFLIRFLGFVLEGVVMGGIGLWGSLEI